MNTAIVPTDIMESVIIKGDLSKLTSDERVKYYNAVCRSVGLNPLTQPFAYMHLSGKQILYAKRDATDQLRALHNVAVEEMTEIVRDGVFIVTCKVRDGKGRTDVSKGAVSITGLKGDALANAMMKAETKAKRRATLSIVGLGFLDETEVETIPDAKDVDEAPELTKQWFAGAEVHVGGVKVEQPAKSISDLEPHKIAAHAEWRGWCEELVARIREAESEDQVEAWLDCNDNALLDLREVDPRKYNALMSAVELHRKAIGGNNG